MQELANQGYPDAQTALADLYAMGKGRLQRTICLRSCGRQLRNGMRENSSLRRTGGRKQFAVFPKRNSNWCDSRINFPGPDLAQKWQPLAAQSQQLEKPDIASTTAGDLMVVQGTQVPAQFERLWKYMDAECSMRRSTM